MKHLVHLAMIALLASTLRCESPTSQDTGIQIHEGFRVERLLSPKASGLGSWVSLAHVAGERFVASDQYGKIYWVDIPQIGKTDTVEVTALEVEGIGEAQGLLWAFESLFVMVNDREIERSGLYRVTDSDEDGLLDSVQLLFHLRGHGEHGTHAVILGPDNLLYLVGGNHTDLPSQYRSILPNVWQEDRLYTSIKDPNGHASRRGAPGGWIARTDSVGSYFEVFATGFRNPYDIAFNEQGELFTFDSDMEWDMGLPWYRPIRVCHVIPGAEFGWRTGSAKWPSYYPDNLPSILDVGQGSPTGVLSAAGLGFPSPFNEGLFICDWSFGTMYHVATTNTGSSYKGNMTEFLSGVPLPLADMTAGPDGALYFTTGGRRLESGLFRVWYEGGELAQAGAEMVPEAINLRRAIEVHQHGKEEPEPELVWEGLAHADRYIQYSARVALENHGLAPWSERIESETDTRRLIQLGIAAARMGDPVEQRRLFAKLSTIDVSGLSDDLQLELIRAQGLLMIRGDRFQPSSDQWIGVFPSSNSAVNEELAYLFMTTADARWLPKVFEAWSQASLDGTGPIIPDSVARRSQQYGRAVMNLRKRRPAAHKIALMNAMSHYETGWNQEMREAFFVGFNPLWDREGGRSYRGFLLAILEQAMGNVPEEKRTRYRDLAGAELGKYGSAVLASLPVPEGPGRNWTVSDVESLMSETRRMANFDNGKKMFDAALCRSCHSIQGSGSNLGPELTQLGNRFTYKDMAVALVDPNAAISDQYAISDLKLKDGSTIQGKVVEEVNDTLQVMMNPLDPEYLRKIPSTEVVSEEASSRSWMFPGMLNRLNEQEVYDLMVFLKAGGDAQHELYK